jgi:hypothetical protein
MTLTMRKTGLESPAYSDDTDYTVYSGKWAVGRIYEDRSSRQEIRWYWTLFGPHAGPDVMRKDGREATLHDAKARLQEHWEKWLEWAALSEKE